MIVHKRTIERRIKAGWSTEAAQNTPSKNDPMDLVGHKFGLLTVLKQVENRVVSKNSGRTAVTWQCQCNCGTIVEVLANGLRTGTTKSCGCFQRAELSKRRTSHGHSKNGRRSSTFSVWQAMLNRCYLKSCDVYPTYGGRGITVCDRWKDSFENFLSDMGERPPDKSLDRINNESGNYEPKNCRWITQKEQCNNKRNNVTTIINGQSMTAMEASELAGIPYWTVLRRIKKGLPFI